MAVKSWDILPHAVADPYPQAGLEHYEVLDVMAVEQALAALMRRCAALPEQAPPSGDSDDIPMKAAPKIGSPSEPIITCRHDAAALCPEGKLGSQAPSLVSLMPAPSCQSSDSMQALVMHNA